MYSGCPSGKQVAGRHSDKMRTGRDDRARIPQRRNLAGGVGRRILNQRACVAHASSRGSMLANDQRYDGLFRGDANVVGRLLLLRPAYLADQDDDLRMRISEEQLQAIDEAHAMDGVSPDPDRLRLAEACGRELADDFACQ